MVRMFGSASWPVLGSWLESVARGEEGVGGDVMRTRRGVVSWAMWRGVACGSAVSRDRGLEGGMGDKIQLCNILIG
jgi:hypothetical protein